MKKILPILFITFLPLLSFTQNTDSWYKVYKGKAGNLVTVRHLHKAGKNYSGYVWFEQNQTPMYIYGAYLVAKSDSTMISSGTSTISFVMTGVFTATGFTGSSRLEKEGSAPKQATFELQQTNEKTYSSFNYYFAEGRDSLPPQFKNASQCLYFSSAVWPGGNSTLDEALKKIYLPAAEY